MVRRLSIHRRLENLETNRKSGPSSPIGPQPDVSTEIANYLESLREWIRSGAAEKPGGLVAEGSAGKLEALPLNPIGRPVKWSVSDYRKISGAEEAEQEGRCCP
jgi:hypothetical protein